MRPMFPEKTVLEVQCAEKEPLWGGIWREKRPKRRLVWLQSTPAVSAHDGPLASECSFGRECACDHAKTRRSSPEVNSQDKSVSNYVI